MNNDINLDDALAQLIRLTGTFATIALVTQHVGRDGHMFDHGGIKIVLGEERQLFKAQGVHEDMDVGEETLCICVFGSAVHVLVDRVKCGQVGVVEVLGDLIKDLTGHTWESVW